LSRVAALRGLPLAVFAASNDALNFSASAHDCFTVPILIFNLRILFTSAWIVSGAAATVDIVVAIMPIDSSAAALIEGFFAAGFFTAAFFAGAFFTAVFLAAFFAVAIFIFLLEVIEMPPGSPFVGTYILREKTDFS
jgi:hypothetical protein